RLLVANGTDETIRLAGKRLSYLAAIGEYALHCIFGVPLPCMRRAPSVDRKPEICLRASHHEFEVIRWLTRRLLPCPWHTCDASILNPATSAFFDFHLQLQVEVAGFLASIDDIIVPPWLSFEGLADHDAIFDAPYGRISIPPIKCFAVEDLLI